MLGPLPVAVIFAYLAAVTALGVRLGRRARSAEEWSVAGGGLSATMLVAGLTGTRIGGAGIYGVAGDVISGGVWNLWWYSISTFLALALVGALFAVPYRRLRLHTVAEAFSMRFGSRRAQVLASLCVQTEYLAVNVIEVYVTAALLRFITGLPLAAAILLAAVVLVSYTAFGGLRGAAATNIVHCAVIVLGLSAVCLAGLESAGGWHALGRAVDARLAEAGRDASLWWSFTGGGAWPVVAMVFAAAIHTPAASIYANFSTSAREERSLLPSFLLAGAVAALIPLLAGLVGVLTLARYGPGPALKSYAAVTTFATDTSPWLGGAAVAAILAAVISTGGPILLSSATLFVRDWLPASARASSEGTLRAYRLTTVGYGALASLLAWAVSGTGLSLLTLLLLGYAMVVPPAIALFFLIHWRRTTEAGAFWGMALGYGCGLLAFALSRSLAPGLDPSHATTLVPLFAVPLVSLATPEQAEGSAAFYATLAGGGRAAAPR